MTIVPGATKTATAKCLKALTRFKLSRVYTRAVLRGGSSVDLFTGADVGPITDQQRADAEARQRRGISATAFEELSTKPLSEYFKPPCRMPCDAMVCPEPSARLSKSSVRYDRRCSSSRSHSPAMPPPIIRTSSSISFTGLPSV